MKTCSACKQEKDTKEFYKSNTTKNGFIAECKKCFTARMNVYFEGEGKKNYEVRKLTRLLISSGEIKKQNCIVCGKKAEVHHNDYENALDITWYCRKHHMEEHRKLKGGVIENIEVKAVRSVGKIYCKNGIRNIYRQAFLRGVGVSKFSDTWDKKTKMHSCCGSRTIWRHKLKCLKVISE